MHGPPVVSWLLASLAAASGAYCLSRLRTTGAGCDSPGAASAAPRRITSESDATEALMGLGMAGMVLVPSGLWGWLYGLLAAGLLLASVGQGAAGPRADRLHRLHRLHHGIGALAMAYMALAMASAPPHGHHGAPVGLPLLTGGLLLYFGCYAMWTGSRLLTTPAGAVRAGAGAGVSRACRLAMGVGMFAMLLTM